VDEAGRTTQPPLIMTPPSLDADPDGEATDAVVDNDFMAPSRTGTGVSLSGVTQRSNGSSGSSGDSAAVAGTAAAEATESEVSTTVPLPADTIGQAKARPSGAASVSSAEDATPSTMSDRKSSYAPAETSSASAAEPAPRPTSSPASASRPGSGSSYSGSSYSDTGTSYSGTGYSTPPTYTRSEWSTGFDSTTAQSGAPASSRSATPASVGRTSSSPAPAGPATPGSAPAGGADVGSASRNGYSSSNGFSSGAASAVGGAAAGLASSVTSAWQNRGSTRGVQARKSAKPTKRQAMLTLARVEPWSVMKFSFVLYMVLSALGVFDSLQNTVSSITSSQSSAGTNISHWFSASLILGYTAMLGALNIVLITAMCTVGSVVYNLIAKTLGGIEVTLRETD
jgi:Transmembrane domain of unknown function (DUF3566)